MPAAFFYAGSAVGVTLAGDLVTLFVFWEMMAIGSTLVIWSAGTRAAYAASLRYAMIHLLGGVVLFAGVVGTIAATGETAFSAMATDSIAHWLVLIGFLVNAGAPPLSAWLPDAYPEGSWSGTVFLSAFTTKAAVYVLLRGFPAPSCSSGSGCFMAFYGIATRCWRTTCGASWPTARQPVGFMVAGIGIGTEMALNGAAAHAFTHIIYKALLLMVGGRRAAGYGRRKCIELAGGSQHADSRPSAQHRRAGDLVVSADLRLRLEVDGDAGAGGRPSAHRWLLLAAAPAGVFLHAGIKFPWFVFFQKDSGLRPADPPASMRWAMILFAFLCLALGVWPEPLYRMLPYPVDFQPYTAAHVLTQLQLLLFSGLAFFVMLSYLKRTRTISLDVDWTWRVLLPALARGGGSGDRGWQTMLCPVAHRRRAAAGVAIALERLPRGLFVRTAPTASMRSGCWQCCWATWCSITCSDAAARRRGHDGPRAMP